MWMAYVKEIEVRDLESGVKHLRQDFSNLRFDALHEANSGNNFYTEDECMKLVERYQIATEICDEYLDGLCTIESLFNRLMDLELQAFLYTIKPFLVDHLARQLKENDGESDDDDDET